MRAQEEKERGKRGKRRSELKQLVVVALAHWKPNGRAEQLRNKTDKDLICALLAEWDFITLFAWSSTRTKPKVTTSAHYPYIPRIRH